MLYFQVAKFWELTPIQFVCRVIWNICECLRIKCPYSHLLFGKCLGKAVAQRVK